MKITNIRNGVYLGAERKEALYDLKVPENYGGELIIFMHGFMGFKDWGCWYLVEKFFTDRGFAFLKYNVSHNGTSLTDPLNFVDTEAFAQNNYSKEILDLEGILYLVGQEFDVLPSINLIGHSRGGGIAHLFSHDNRIARIISWAGISSIESRFPKGDELEAWKQAGRRTVHNGRTKQDLPIAYSQFEDFLKNRKRLNIAYYCQTSAKPSFVIHGDQDDSVKIQEGKTLAEYLQVELCEIAGANHTFNSSHPWQEEKLPAALEQACQETFRFLSIPIDQERNQNVSAIVEMIKLAKSDDDLREEEFKFILTLASMMGIGTDEFKTLFEKYISFNPPTLEFDRILQFQRLVLLMNIDHEVDEEELNHVRSVGIRMGLNPLAIERVLQEMKLHPHNMIPPNILMEIFQVFHN